MTARALDAWLPSAAVKIHHRRTAAADPATLWRAATAIRLAETHALGRMVRWRIPGLDGSLTYHEMFRAYPFCVLEESEHRLVSGLCGRIWTLTHDYPVLHGPDEFAAWDKPGTVRVAFSHVARAVDGRRSELVTEARVAPTDRHASLRLRAMWAVLGPFERLVGSEPLSLAVKRAEARANGGH